MYIVKFECVNVDVIIKLVYKFSMVQQLHVAIKFNKTLDNPGCRKTNFMHQVWPATEIHIVVYISLLLLLSCIESTTGYTNGGKVYQPP